MIGIVLVTCNRPHLLKLCLQNVVARTSPLTTEILIWNNGDSPEAKEIITAAVAVDNRIRVIDSPRNVGTNAYARAFREIHQPYLIELDDDVIDAPAEWDRQMHVGFLAAPGMGFLAADMIEDPKSLATQIRYGSDQTKYQPETIGGFTYMWGPTGGWCTMTTRFIYDQVGGFRENPTFDFWHEDGDFSGRVVEAGYRVGLLNDVKVHHASGPEYSSAANIDAAKSLYYNWRSAGERRNRRNRRIKDLVKKLLLWNLWHSRPMA